MIALFSCLVASHVSVALKIPGAEIDTRTLQQDSLLRQYISQSLNSRHFGQKGDDATNGTRLPRLHLTKTAAERLLTQPPRYMFGISTGHAGSTSLSDANSYSGSGKSKVTFKFEEDYHAGWKEWVATKPSLEEQERKVKEDYKAPIDELLDEKQSQTYVDLGHHNVLGILRTTPKVFGDDAFFIRFRRDRAHTVYSFNNSVLTANPYGLCAIDFSICPVTDAHLLSPHSGKWTNDTWSTMTFEQQYLWFVDEVEAQFQQLLQENPDVSYLECNWSDDLGPCFEIVSSILGLQVEDGGVHVKLHTKKNPLSSEDKKRILQADEDYGNVMEYTDEIRNSISEVQF